MALAIGRIVLGWGDIDRHISRAIEAIEKALAATGQSVQHPGIPARFTDRLTKYRKLVLSHCDDAYALQRVRDQTDRLQDWTNLRDDLTHGEVQMLIDTAGKVGIYIVPLHGRKIRRDRAYFVPIETIELDVIGVLAGFGGLVTGIVMRTERSIFMRPPACPE